MTILLKQTLQLIVILSLSLSAHTEEIFEESCLQYSDGICIRCDSISRLIQGNCYLNILGCIRYAAPTICIQCDPTSFQLNGSTCSMLPGISNSRFTLRDFGDKNIRDPGYSYGQADFNPSSLEQLSGQPTYQALDSFIRFGIYSHFISRTVNPVYSINYYINNNIYSYKILYYGSGGGLMLCIADVNQKNEVNLRSLNAISSSNIIDFCTNYDTDQRCLRCGNNYHLQDGKCYPNYGGCVRYKQNICLQCMDYYLLIENRCVSDCYSVSDARSVLYYGENRFRSTLEGLYGINISQFYTMSIRETTNAVIKTFTTSGFVIKPITSSSTQTSSQQATIANLANTNDRFNINTQVPNLLLNRTTITNTIITNTTISTQNSSLFGNSLFNTRDPNCRQYDARGGCVTCAETYFKNSFNICEMVDPFCANFDQKERRCTFCYPGFTLLNSGKCQITKN